MRNLLLTVASIASAALAWGLYGPALHEGQHLMASAGGLARLRPFVCVGVAYFLIGVLVPATILATRGEKGRWTALGAVWSLLAGALGAMGALGLVLAFTYGGRPDYVMPLVFGGAPVVNSFLTIYWAKKVKEIGPLFLAGLVMVVLGAVTVLVFQPSSAPSKTASRDAIGLVAQAEPAAPSADAPSAEAPSAEEAQAELAADVAEESAGSAEADRNGSKRPPVSPEPDDLVGSPPLGVAPDADEPPSNEPPSNEPPSNEPPSNEPPSNAPQQAAAGEGGAEQDAEAESPAPPSDPEPDTAGEPTPKTRSRTVEAVERAATDAASFSWRVTKQALSIALVVFCWGAYGPVLHSGQGAMAGSRLRPLLCVGLAYFAIAVVLPNLLLAGPMPEASSYRPWGTFWSLAAGSLGALGALAIILAFHFGGKPVYVMPLVFGGAPVVNTFATIASRGGLDRLHPMFLAGLILVIAGAAMVLVFAPRGHGPARPAEPRERDQPDAPPPPKVDEPVGAPDNPFAGKAE